MYCTVLFVKTIMRELRLPYIVLALLLSCTKSISPVVDSEPDNPLYGPDGTILPGADYQDVHLLSDTSFVMLSNGLILEKRDGLYYWDDMVFTEQGLDYLVADGTRSAYRDQCQFYWPYDIVYYKYNANYIDTVCTRAAMDTISSKTAIIFKPQQYSYQDCIEFVKSTSVNNSPVGMQSGSQTINIMATGSTNTIIHEIMHSLGFFHEHTRSDRDAYIEVKWSNIRPEKRHNFQKYSVYYSGMDFGMLDFDSIMLYGSMIYNPAFVYDTSLPAMTKIDGTTFLAGTGLSAGDIAGVSSIYGPPFHRLENHLLRVIEDSTPGFAERYITENADSIIFYGDRSCTVRQALTYPRRIRIITTTDINQGSGLEHNSYASTITIPAGTTAYCLWHGTNSYIYYCSDPSMGYNVTQHEIDNVQVPSAYYY